HRGDLGLHGHRDLELVTLRAHVTDVLPCGELDAALVLETLAPEAGAAQSALCHEPPPVCLTPCMRRPRRRVSTRPNEPDPEEIPRHDRRSRMVFLQAPVTHTPGRHTRRTREMSHSRTTRPGGPARSTPVRFLRRPTGPCCRPPGYRAP